MTGGREGEKEGMVDGKEGVMRKRQGVEERGTTDGGKVWRVDGRVGAWA